MASQDKMVYFDLYARGEPIRMLYAAAGKPLEEKRISFEEWSSIKDEQPLGQLPVFECEHGTMVMSNSIARFVAKRFGLYGSCGWEEALNDMVVETMQECLDQIGYKIYFWLILKRTEEPENPEQVKEEVKAYVVQRLAFVESVAIKRGKRFIIDNKISLGDIWVFSGLSFASLVFPDIMEINPWVKDFVAKFKEDETMKKYLAERPPSAFGI